MLAALDAHWGTSATVFGELCLGMSVPKPSTPQLVVQSLMVSGASSSSLLPSNLLQ